MSVKRLLGLDSFPLTEAEIMRKLEDAFKDNRSEVVFTSKKKEVKVKLNQLSPLGLMDDYRDYFAQ